MKDVMFLENIYPCWSYALARVGRKDDFSFDWLKYIMPKLLVPYSNQNLLSGNLLVWKAHNPSIYYLPVHIEYDGQIISEQIKYEHHVAVFEGQGLCSDMVHGEGEFAIPFIIRMRKVTQLSNPDYIITFE